MHNSKIVRITRPNFFQILKSVHTVGNNFFRYIFCQKHEQNSAATKKNGFFFFKSTKTVFTVLENISFLCNLCGKFRLYRYIFYTVKRENRLKKKTPFF